MGHKLYTYIILCLQILNITPYIKSLKNFKSGEYIKLYNIYYIIRNYIRLNIIHKNKFNKLNLKIIKNLSSVHD